ncbi:MAG: vitamin K epoxide reductase family protein [bacterium]|nr:vitamin K epoxide reductase family protein [bacterium]
MNNLKKLLKQPLKAIPSSLALFILIVAVLGFADATYLTVEHYRGVIPPCSVASGCETVLTSVYSKIFGIPVSLFGAIYYLLILIGVYSYFDTKKTVYLKWALLLTSLGFLMTLGLVYIMAFVLKAYCQYCLLSAATSTILFVTALIVLSKYRNSDMLLESNATTPTL